MAEFQPVPIGRPPPRSWLPALGSALAIILALAVVKPWRGPEFGDRVAVAPSPSAGAVTARTARPRADRTTYDPRLFGYREPDPAWELWPAGYVVEFGIAGPVVVRGQESPAPSGDVPPSTAPGATHDGGPRPSAPVPGSPDEHVVDLGAADHLIALGINTPAHVRVVEVMLWKQAGAVCCDQAVPIIRLPAPWDSDHFLVIGIADPDRPGDTARWLAGEYRLDLVTVGGEVRSVRLRVAAPAD